jgi:enamine deaminase RidA (YjgF/YER057c/UK114 family)
VERPVNGDGGAGGPDGGTEDPGPESPHRIVNAEALPPPVGFSHALVPAAGTPVLLGGQTAVDTDGRIVGADVVTQLDRAATNVVAALAAAGGRPEHLVWLQIFVTDLDVYRGALRELGVVYRRRFGRHYPPMALVEVSRLFDADALVELVGAAVVPDQAHVRHA